MSRFTSFVGFGLIVDDLLQFVEQFTEVFGDEVSSDGVYLVEVIGGFPLVDVEFGVGVVEPAVVVEHSPSHLQISETDASGQPSQIVNGPIVLPEKLEDLIGLGVIDVEDFLFGESGVVGTIGDWP